MAKYERTAFTGETVPLGWTQIGEEDTGEWYEYGIEEDGEEAIFPIMVISWEPEDKAWSIEAYLTYPHPGMPEEAHLMLGFAVSFELADKFVRGYKELQQFLLSLPE